jgi:16S rRNA (guanine527-N7)-methyltransferase
VTGLDFEDVSRETSDRLQVFESLVRKWNPTINLISRNSLADIRDRHIRDSVQIYSAVQVAYGQWVDLGSGGGFPGIVIAILAAEKSPTSRVTLIESDARKATFLRTALRETGVSAHVITDRIEHAAPQNADIVSARALADLPDLLSYAARHLTPNGTAIFPKGATWRDELEQAKRQWNFSVESVTSLTDPSAAILRITGVSRA